MSLRILLSRVSFKSISKSVAHRMPLLKKDLWIAQINKKPEEYIEEKLKLALVAGVAIAIMTFFLVDKMGKSKVLVFISFIFFTWVFFTLFKKQVKAKVMQRQKDIDREVLFAGRFLLVKLNSGKPLINAIIEASNSYGVANKYFKSIVHEINTGTPLEQALEKAVKYCPSDKMKKILFQITNSLKIGMDVSQSLEASLDQISDEQLIEIQRYGKKLSSVTMFYMLGAVVLPSLGLTIFVVIASMVNIKADLTLFSLILFFLIIIELIFMSVFRAIRPNVNI